MGQNRTLGALEFFCMSFASRSRPSIPPKKFFKETFVCRWKDRSKLSNWFVKWSTRNPKIDQILKWFWILNFCNKASRWLQVYRDHPRPPLAFTWTLPNSSGNRPSPVSIPKRHSFSPVPLLLQSFPIRRFNLRQSRGNRISDWKQSHQPDNTESPSILLVSLLLTAISGFQLSRTPRTAFSNDKFTRIWRVSSLKGTRPFHVFPGALLKVVRVDSSSELGPSGLICLNQKSQLVSILIITTCSIKRRTIST